MVDTSNYGVIMGTSKAMKWKGVCQHVELKLGSIVIYESFLPLEMGRVDVILGMQWLFTLGSLG